MGAAAVVGEKLSSNILDEAISPLRRPHRRGHQHETLRDLGKDRDPSEDINPPERSNACPANYRISGARAVGKFKAAS